MPDRNPSIIVDTLKQRLVQGDLMVITVKDSARDSDIRAVVNSLGEFTGDSKTFVLVFSERVFSGIRSMGLRELLETQDQIAEAIKHIAARDSAGES
jgi:hypothetical protein